MGRKGVESQQLWGVSLHGGVSHLHAGEIKRFWRKGWSDISQNVRKSKGCHGLPNSREVVISFRGGIQEKREKKLVRDNGRLILGEYNNAENSKRFEKGNQIVDAVGKNTSLRLINV